MKNYESKVSNLLDSSIFKLYIDIDLPKQKEIIDELCSYLPQINFSYNFLKKMWKLISDLNQNSENNSFSDKFITIIIEVKQSSMLIDAKK